MKEPQPRMFHSIGRGLTSSFEVSLRLLDGLDTLTTSPSASRSIVPPLSTASLALILTAIVAFAPRLILPRPLCDLIGSKCT